MISYQFGVKWYKMFFISKFISFLYRWTSQCWGVYLYVQEKKGNAMLLKSCKRCGNLIPYGRVYCTTCQPIVDAQREARRVENKRASDRRYNKTRDPKYGRFYKSAGWRTLSKKRLQDDGYKCVKCGEIASEVDHIIPIQTPEGWERRLDYDNTQSLCLECHNIKHNRFKKKAKTRNRLEGR